MSIQPISASHAGPIYPLPAVMVAMALWATINIGSDLQNTNDAMAPKDFHCHDAADVLAAQDRSRNGISITCNHGTLLRGGVR